MSNFKQTDAIAQFHPQYETGPRAGQQLADHRNVHLFVQRIKNHEAIKLRGGG